MGAGDRLVGHQQDGPPMARLPQLRLQTQGLAGTVPVRDTDQELEVSRVFPGHYKLAIPVSLIGEINEGFSQIEQNGQLKQGKGLFDFGDVKIHI